MTDNSTSPEVKAREKSLVPWHMREVDCYTGGTTTWALIDERGNEWVVGTRAEIALFFASRELLAACEQFIRQIDTCKHPLNALATLGVHSGMIANMRSAIARAEGRST